ncbi:hypothetical protein LSO07_18730 [Janthinobacterium sp. PLB04]|uniref:Type II secretion system protein GspC N-terminal domain-containing protein n=1 Tax=Janthinobacterium lividum TaxID=29581 RepID=A0AAJ4MPT2_9BURK|nr:MULTISPECIES: hypothetical protein [Janthinobacterium]KAB0325615.1 hypothetical protein F3B38_18460 [Janthinobacterium lividum]QSX94722.1 hypothetical protein J3P46_18615 [Janthinobacterium lividum]UGQ34536.1 hypothetical protein LSO07_18730 [Janthinobacterium sp. PLB04]
MKRTLILGALLAGAALSVDAQAQQLGRLFLSPEQRTQLDAQRYGPPPADPALAAAAPPPPPPPPAPPVELNGVVQRSSGHSTVWLNQEVQNEPHNRLALGKPGTLTLRLSNGQVVLLKPGQRYDPASGTVTEVQETPP